MMKSIHLMEPTRVYLLWYVNDRNNILLKFDVCGDNYKVREATNQLTC